MRVMSMNARLCRQRGVFQGYSGKPGTAYPVFPEPPPSLTPTPALDRHRAEPGLTKIPQPCAHAGLGCMHEAGNLCEGPPPTIEHQAPHSAYLVAEAGLVEVGVIGRAIKVTPCEVDALLSARHPARIVEVLRTPSYRLSFRACLTIRSG